MGQRRAAALEAALVFALIMLYIWWLRYRYPAAWLAILGLVVASHAWRGETAAALGFRTLNLGRCLEEYAPFLVLTALSLIAGGMLLGTIRPIRFDDWVAALVAYLPWGLFQQYLLNGYFGNRIGAAAPPRTAALWSAAAFGAAHLPNWYLLAVAFGGGYCAAVAYGKYRNLYFLGIAHGVIGFLLYLVTPDSISHHLRVGPGYFGR